MLQVEWWPFWVRAYCSTGARCFFQSVLHAPTLPLSAPASPHVASGNPNNWKLKSTKTQNRSAVPQRIFGSAPCVLRNVCGLVSCWRRDAESCFDDWIFRTLVWHSLGLSKGRTSGHYVILWCDLCLFPSNLSGCLIKFWGLCMHTVIFLLSKSFARTNVGRWG